MAALNVVLKGTGHYLPERVVPNAHFARYLDTSDDWIKTRTGINERRFAAADETTSQMAVHAARQALANAECEADDIDLVLLATSTPDLTFPATATLVQSELGIRQGCAFDIQAVCAGFVFAVATADSLLRSGMARRALVIGSEVFSRILDTQDRSTCILFGDGAGAVVLAADTAAGPEPAGILATDIHSDGRHWDLLYVDGGVSSTGTIGALRMKGQEVYRHAVTKLVASTGACMAKAGLSCGDITWMVPHQANLRIINTVANRLALAPEQAIITLDVHGNTSAASIPLALSVANENGHFNPGDILVSQAIGGGFSWGSFILRWGSDGRQSPDS